MRITQKTLIDYNQIDSVIQIQRFVGGKELRLDSVLIVIINITIGICLDSLIITTMLVMNL